MREILGPGESLDEAANWPDEMRSDPAVFWQKTSTPWHYVTLNGITYDHAPPEGDALEALDHFSKVLQDPNASLADKQTALRFVVHLVGDLHQPLHVGKCCDRGGNDVKVTWFGKPTNLHAVWDSALVDDEQLSFTELAAKLERHISDRQLIDWWDINPRDWISESARISRHALSDRRGHAEAEEGREAEEGQAAGSRSVLFLRLPVHAVDGAAAEPGGSEARGLSQRDLRRAAGASGAAGAMIRRLLGRARGAAAFGLRGAGSAAADRCRRRSRCRSSRSTISTATSKRRRSRSRSPSPTGRCSRLRVGGAAQLAAALDRARQGHPNTITVAAGDLIGASPLASAYFLDEPTIDAMNLLGLSVASVGNHEFDKGSAELLRMQNGGCGKNTSRVPCRLEPFAGARFQYLAANVVRSDGKHHLSRRARSRRSGRSGSASSARR